MKILLSTCLNNGIQLSNVIELSNSGRGDVKRATISLQKKTDHFFIKGSYTTTSSSEVSTGTSSRAVSNWNNRPSFNPNSEELGISNYQIGNAFTMQASYENNLFGDTLTTFNVFWNSTDGENYSYTYGNDVNGDGVRDNDLFYVPNADEYVMSDPSERAAFENYLAISGLDKFRGQIPTRNNFHTPRVNQWDIKIRQELPAMGRFRGSVFATIKNVGNMLNKNWGRVYVGRFDGINIANLEGFDDQQRAILDFRGRNTVKENLSYRTISSQWQAQVGFRLEF